MQEVFPKLKDVNVSIGRVCFWTLEEATLRMASFLSLPVFRQRLDKHLPGDMLLVGY